MHGLAWVFGALWALAGAFIALGSGRSYLWRIAVFLGPLAVLLIPPEERPEWFTPSAGDPHDDVHDEKRPATPVETQGLPYTDTAPTPIETTRMIDPDFDLCPKLEPKCVSSHDVTAAELGGLSLGIGVVLVFAIIMAANSGNREGPNAATQGGLDDNQDVLRVAPEPMGPQIVQQGPVAEREADVPSPRVEFRPPLMHARLPQPAFIPSAREESQRRFLGIDEEPVTFFDGRQRMMVRRVCAGTPADRAGLKNGDVLWSVNGYATQNYGDLAWIIANQTPGNTLQISVNSPLYDMSRFVIVDITQYPR